MSKLRVDRIDFNDSGNVFISVSNTWNVSVYANNAELITSYSNGTVVFPGSTVIIGGSNVGASLTAIGSAFDKANAALANTTTTLNGNLTVAGSLTSTGVMRDNRGDVRDLPIINQVVGYALTLGDSGEVISTNTTVFVPNTVFFAGNAVSIFNNSAASITVTQNSSVTMYLGGTATTGNRTLAQRGVATVLCVAANTFVISGAGLT